MDISYNLYWVNTDTDLYPQSRLSYDLYCPSCLLRLVFSTCAGDPDTQRQINLTEKKQQYCHL